MSLLSAASQGAPEANESHSAWLIRWGQNPWRFKAAPHSFRASFTTSSTNSLGFTATSCTGIGS